MIVGDLIELAVRIAWRAIDERGRNHGGLGGGRGRYGRRRRGRGRRGSGRIAQTLPHVDELAGDLFLIGQLGIVKLMLILIDAAAVHVHWLVIVQLQITANESSIVDHHVGVVVDRVHDGRFVY